MTAYRGAIWRLREGDAAMAVSPLWRDEPPQSRGSRWRERLGWVALLSILIHAAIVAIVFLQPPPPPPRLTPSDESPPGEVALVFQGGSSTGPTSPNPSPEVSAGPTSPDTALTAPPPGIMAPPDAAPAPPPPSAEPVVPPPPPPIAMLPAPQFVPPTAVPIPPPTPPLAKVTPPPPPRPPPPRPAPPRPRVATPRPDAFPKPLNFAFGNGLVGSNGSVGRAPPHESMGPVQPGPSSRSAFSSDISGDIGPDYRALLRAWFEAHKHYPEQAAENGEDGSTTVRLVVRKDGRVQEVELQERSGSQWLDLGTTGMFRGQKLPAFPSDAMGEQQEIYVTIHYILIRG